MADQKVTLKRVIDTQGNTDTILPTTSWDQIEEKPSTFPPTAHTHTVEDIDSETTTQGLVIVSDGEGGAVWADKMEVDASNSDVLDLKFQNQDTDDALAVGELRLNRNLPEWQVSANTRHLVGQQLITRARNKTGANATTGLPVFISGVFTPSQGGPGTDIKEYELADRDTDPAVFAIASCPAAIDADGCVITRGVVKGWNTSSFVANDNLYLTDTPGQYTTTKPTSGRVFFVGKVIRAANDGIVFVSPSAAVDPTIATQGQAEAGTDNETFMTPLRTAQAIAALAEGGANVVVDSNPPENPSEGDLWFDDTELTLYIFYVDETSGQWISVSGESMTTIFVDDEPPTNPAAGALWFNSTDLKLYIYYVDATSSQWIAVLGSGSGGASVTVSNTPPADPAEGDLWFDNGSLTLFVYYDDGDSQQWVNAAGGLYTGGLDSIVAGTGLTGGGTSGEITIAADIASQAEAEAGTATDVLMTPQRVGQAIAALQTTPTIASQSEAETGTDDTVLMTPLKTAQAIAELVPAETGLANVFYLTLTIATADWVEQTSGDWDGQYLAVKTLSGLLSTDLPSVDLDLTGATSLTAQTKITAFNKIFAWQVTDANEITFYASQDITEELTFNIQVVR